MAVVNGHSKVLMTWRYFKPAVVKCKNTTQGWATAAEAALFLHMMFVHTHSLAIGFIQWTLLFDLGQLHVHLLTDHRHRITSCG